MRATLAIEAKSLTRVFRTYKKKPGLSGAIQGLFHREYERTTAVDAVSFSIHQGECVGFLGPNGAGKTTTLKMLAGLLHPTSGSASVLGFIPWERKQEYRRQFALLLGQKNQLWWDLPARESLALNGKIYRIPERELHRRVSELTDLLDVSEKLDVMVRELSLGERMKFELIAALLHQPKVLFLDEPTIGLDVVSQQTVREFLRRHNRAFGTTIVLTSHYMADIEAVCDRAIIIDAGAVSFDGELEEIVDRFADDRVVAAKLACGDMPRVHDLPLEVLEFVDRTLRVKVAREHYVLVCKALLNRHELEDFEVQDVTAEDVIRSLFSRSANDRGGTGALYPAMEPALAIAS